MLQVNDVGHHSFHVAWFAYLLAEAHEENGGDRLAINGIATL
jgi:5'-deoxynucleotidase YfbR-like HD superfamily hydrolase